METISAAKALAALAQVHRLNIFRLLVREGPAGLAAGAIAARLALPASSLSFHLSQLEHSGLIASKRVQRNIFYSLDVEGTRQLLSFLTQDCCQGDPNICGVLASDPLLCKT